MTQKLRSLDEVGLQTGTDKASHAHDYLGVYDRYIRNLAEAGDGGLLELGWFGGASMRMWRDWLPEGWSVSGLDIEDKEPIEGVNFILGDQRSSEIAERAANLYGPWDVIVDDASHLSPLTIGSFQAYWPYLRPGGFYFVEDLEVSYRTEWYGNPDPDRKGPQGQTIMQFLKNLTDDVHYQHGSGGPNRLRIVGDRIASISFYPGLCVVQKEN